MRLEAFAGLWRIERILEDRCGGQDGRLTGHACFAPIEGGLAYRETGMLRLGNRPPLRAARSYLWRAAGETIELAFEDGRFFHRIPTGATAPEAVHDCPPDRYRVRYDFARWPVWETLWQVEGPRKDYRMHTRYRPAGQKREDPPSPGDIP